METSHESLLLTMKYGQRRAASCNPGMAPSLQVQRRTGRLAKLWEDVMRKFTKSEEDTTTQGNDLKKQHHIDKRSKRRLNTPDDPSKTQQSNVQQLSTALSPILHDLATTLPRLHVTASLRYHLPAQQQRRYPQKKTMRDSEK